MDYLYRYPINADMLSVIEELDFDGGLEIYRYINNQWDGESREFDITSLRDVQKLPNLKKLNLYSMINFSNQEAELIKQLEARGVEIVQ